MAPGNYATRYIWLTTFLSNDKLSAIDERRWRSRLDSDRVMYVRPDHGGSESALGTKGTCVGIQPERNSRCNCPESSVSLAGRSIALDLSIINPRTRVDMERVSTCAL